MILNFNEIEEQVIPNFKGGEKQFRTRMYTDASCKIMRGSLEPGAAIGVHTHETNSEIIFMVKGTVITARRDTATVCATRAMRQLLFMRSCRNNRNRRKYGG